MFNFGQQVQEKSFDVIPKGSLAFCSFKIRGIKNSRQTNGRYLDVELTVMEGQPFAGRKIYDTIADAYDTLNSQEYRDMGVGKIRRILEAVANAHPSNPQSYNLSSYEQMNSMIVPVYIDIQKGKDGYDDKNIVDYLSPQSSLKKIVECFGLLKSGVFVYAKDNKPAAGAAQQTSGFMAPAGTPVSTAGFSAPQAAQPAGQSQAFQQSPAQTGPGWLAPTPAATPAPAQQQTMVQQPQQAGFVAPQPGFHPGQAPAQQVDHSANVAGQQPQQTATDPAATPASTFPSNTEGQAVQFPNGNGAQ